MKKNQNADLIFIFILMDYIRILPNSSFLTIAIVFAEIVWVFYNHGLTNVPPGIDSSLPTATITCVKKTIFRTAKNCQLILANVLIVQENSLRYKIILGYQFTTSLRMPAPLLF